MTKQIEFLDSDLLNSLNIILEKHNPKSIFLVTGNKSYTLCGAENKIKTILKKYKCFKFNDFSVNPKLNEIVKGIELYKNNECDLVIAIGGGSVIDVAKAINILSANDDNPDDYVTGKKCISTKGAPLIAIPTTAGSGSEATHFAVVYIDKTKYSLAHEHILPDYAIIDYSLTLSLPQKITAETGMDALSQAIEAYWSVNSTDESKQYATKAIRLILGNLEDAVLNNTNDSKNAMALAAHLSGKAINISKTTACHAISYPITSYFNIPHGHAVGLTIPSMIVFNSNVNESNVLDKRGLSYVQKMMNELINILDVDSPIKAKEKISDLMVSIGLNIKLNELKIFKKNIEIIIKNGFNPDRVKNNPRIINEKDLKQLLVDIL